MQCSSVVEGTFIDLQLKVHHISFLREDSIVQTLHSHPSEWQLHRSLSIISLSPLSEVVPGIDIL